MTLPSSIAKVRDEKAAEWINATGLTEPKDEKSIRMISFEEGFESCFKHLTEMSGEFDHTNYGLWIMEKFENSNAPSRKQCALWQHLQISASFQAKQMKLESDLAVAIEALRKSILWSESLYIRLLNQDDQNINFTYLNDAREAFSKLGIKP